MPKPCPGLRVSVIYDLKVTDEHGEILPVGTKGTIIKVYENCVQVDWEGITRLPGAGTRRWIKKDRFIPNVRPDSMVYTDLCTTSSTDMEMKEDSSDANNYEYPLDEPCRCNNARGSTCSCKTAQT